MPSFVRVANGGEAGMLTVETIGRVRREFHVKGKKIKTIARELRVSRNTVRRIVRGDETVHRYARKEQPLPQLGMHVAALEEMLTANVLASRSASG
jgi:predicted transcriptional regulator